MAKADTPQAARRASEGQRKLARFLAETRTTLAEVARSIGVSAPSVHAWREGTKTPRREHARALQRVTRGAVRVADWITDSERERLDSAAE